MRALRLAPGLAAAALVAGPVAGLAQGAVARWPDVTVSIALAQSERSARTVANGGCRVAVASRSERALAASGTARLRVAGGGGRAASAALRLAPLTGRLTVTASAPVRVVGGDPAACAGIGAAAAPPVDPARCGSRALRPRVRVRMAPAPPGVSVLRVRVAVSFPWGVAGGRCAARWLPDGVRPRNATAVANPGTVIGTIPLAAILDVHTWSRRFAAVSLVRDTATDLVDRSGATVGRASVRQRVLITVLP